jgi:4-hydroxymandelate oxidase
MTSNRNTKTSDEGTAADARWSYDTTSHFATLSEVFEAARANLEPAVWDYLDGGAGDELTLAENRRAFARWQFRPRALSGISPPDTRTTFLDIPLSMPVLTSPFGSDRLFHPDGHLAVARANAQFGVASIVPEASSFSLEEIQSTAPAAARIFQLHPLGTEENFLRMIHRAEDAGYDALCVTADSPTGGWRERSMHTRFSPDLDALTGNYPPPAREDAMKVFGQLFHMDQPIWSWAKVANLCSHSHLPFMVKGILTAEDARAAVDAGASAILVSNHGGRQLDSAPAALEQLAEVVTEVGGKVEIVLDSGVRRGSDILKGLALGANVVVIGRAAAMGLAANGEDGVYRVLELMQKELVTTMALVGCPKIASVERSFVQLSPSARER